MSPQKVSSFILAGNVTAGSCVAALERCWVDCVVPTLRCATAAPLPPLVPQKESRRYFVRPSPEQHKSQLDIGQGTTIHFYLLLRARRAHLPAQGLGSVPQFVKVSFVRFRDKHFQMAEEERVGHEKPGGRGVILPAPQYTVTVNCLYCYRIISCIVPSTALLRSPVPCSGGHNITGQYHITCSSPSPQSEPASPPCRLLPRPPAPPPASGRGAPPTRLAVCRVHYSAHWASRP